MSGSYSDQIGFSEQFTSDDLMNSFHLLLCTVDFVFHDLRQSNLVHLLDGDFGKPFINASGWVPLNPYF